MKFDIRLVTGVFVGVILGLQYHEVLVAYMPLLMVPTLVLLLKIIHR